jgi:hypothetical protein
MPLKMHDSPQRRKSANAGVRLISFTLVGSTAGAAHIERHFYPWMVVALLVGVCMAGLAFTA